MKIKIKKLNDNAVYPTYATDGSAGIDLTVVSHKVDKYGCDVYGTSLAVAIPSGYVGLIFPRSSVAKKQQRLTNCVGVIDSDYRGEIMLKFKPDCVSANPFKIWLKNFSWFKRLFKRTSNQEVVYTRNTDCSYKIGERAAQMIIVRIPKIVWEDVDDLGDTERGDGGYGHTGD